MDMVKVSVHTWGDWLGTLDFIEDGVARRILDNREVCAYNVMDASLLGSEKNVIRLTVGKMSMTVEVGEYKPPKRGLVRRFRDAFSALFRAC